MSKVDSSKLLVTPRPCPEAKLRLFCFHHAGGAAHLFWNWPAHFAPEVEICAVQLPGRGSRLTENLEPSISAVVTEFFGTIQAKLAEKPYAFFGHSMGSLVAFELARRLRAENLGPRHLFVSACRAAQLYAATKRPQLSKLTDQELTLHLEKLGGTPPELLREVELMGILVKILRDDYRLLDAYSFEEGPRLNCPITVFGGEADTETNSRTLLPWAKLTDGRSELVSFPGGHFYFQDRLPQLTEKILARLKEGMNS